MLNRIRPIFYVLCCLLDSLVITCSKEVIKDFLRGVVGKKRANIIWNKSKYIERALLSFIPQYLPDNYTEFKRYYSVYRVFILSIIPQYALLFVVDFLFRFDTVTKITYLIKLIYSISLFLFFRLPQLPHGVSKFIHKKKH